MNESDEEVKIEGDEQLSPKVEDPEEPMNEEEEKLGADDDLASERTTEELVKDEKEPFFSR